MCFPWRGLSRALLVAASLSMVGGLAGRAAAQNSPDPSVLDTTDAQPEGKAKAKKKSAQQKPPQQQPSAPQAKGAKPGGDRQFGELEGWSPGKRPNADKDSQGQSGSDSKAPPLSMSPSGKPSVGLTF